MSPIAAQGIFHVIYTAAFFALGVNLLSQSKKSGNQIGRALGGTFFAAGVEYTAITVAVLAFSDNLPMVKFLTSVIATAGAMAAITFAVPIISYVFPKVSVKPVIAVMGMLTVVMLIQNILVYKSPGITAMGTLHVSGPQWQIMTIGVLMMFIFVPIGAGFIYKTFKSKQYLKGALLGLGIAIGTLFLPVTYQVTSFNAYVFFNTLASIGFALIIVGLLVRPSVQPQNKRLRGAQ